MGRRSAADGDEDHPGEHLAAAQGPGRRPARDAHARLRPPRRSRRARPRPLPRSPRGLAHGSPRGRRRDARGRPRALSRRPSGRPRLRAVRPAAHRSSGGAAARGPRGAHRRRPRRRAARRARRRARRPRPRASAARAAAPDSSCWRCTDPADSPTRWTPTARRTAPSPRSWGWSRAPSCRRSSGTSCSTTRVFSPRRHRSSPRTTPARADPSWSSRSRSIVPMRCSSSPCRSHAPRPPARS